MLVYSDSFSLPPSDFPGISQKTAEIQLKFRERKRERGKNGLKQVGESGFGIWQIGFNFEHDSFFIYWIPAVRPCTEKTRLKFFSSKLFQNDTYLAMAMLLSFLVLLSPDALARSWSSFRLEVNTRAGKCNGIISFLSASFAPAFPLFFSFREIYD